MPNNETTVFPAPGQENFLNPSPQGTAPETFGYTRPPLAPSSQKFSKYTNVKDYGYLTDIGQLVKESSKEVVRQMGEQAKEATQQAIEPVRNQQAGLGYALDTGEIPADIQSGVKEVRRLNGARKAGAMSQSQYDTELALRVKKLKAQWPEFQETIDREVSGIVGYTPANQLIRDLYAGQKQAAAAANKYQTYLDTNAGYIVQKWPNFFTGLRGTDKEPDPNVVRQAVADFKGQEELSKFQNSQITQRVNAGKLDDTTAKLAARAFNTRFYSDFDNAIGRATGGVTDKTLQEEITKATLEGPLNTKQIAELDTHFQLLEGSYHQHFEQSLDADQGGWTFRQRMTPQAIEQTRKQLDDRLGAIKERLYNKDYGTILALSRRGDYAVANTQGAITLKNDVARLTRAVAQPNFFGPLAGQLLTDTKFVNEASHLLTLDSLMSAATGETTSMEQAYKRAEKEPGSDPGEVTNHLMKESFVKLSNPNVGDDAKVNLLKMMTSPDSAAFYDRILEQDHADPRLNLNLAKNKVYARLSTPEMAKLAKDLSERKGDPSIYNNYKNFIKDRIDAQLLTDAGLAASVSRDNNGVSLRWNPTTHNLDVDNQHGFWNVNQWPYTKAQQSAVEKVNMFLSTYSNILRADGMSEQEIDTELQNYLVDPAHLGIDINSPEGPTVLQSTNNMLGYIWEVIKPKYNVFDSVKTGSSANVKDTKAPSLFPEPMHLGGPKPQEQSLTEDKSLNAQIAKLGLPEKTHKSVMDALDLLGISQAYDKSQPGNYLGDVQSFLGVSAPGPAKVPGIAQAAIKMADGSIAKGIMHFDALEKWAVDHGETFDNALRLRKESGFLTTDGKFVNREEAMKIAKEASQAPKQTTITRLVSEDLHRWNKGEPPPEIINRASIEDLKRTLKEEKLSPSEKQLLNNKIKELEGAQ